MRSIKKHIILLVAIFISNSCTDHFETFNTNPHALTLDKVDVSLIGQAFAKAQYYSIYGRGFRYQIAQNLYSDLYCQYFATTTSMTYFETDRYIQVEGLTDEAWKYFYTQAAPNIKLVEETAHKNGLESHYAIASVWNVYAYHRLTDYWGPIIFSEFGNGKTSVPYDSQESIYRSFFSMLDEVVSTLRANIGGNAFGDHDLLYGGDVDQWRKFANTLRLRLALRIKYANYELAKAQAELAVLDGVMESNKDNALLLTTPDSPNPINMISGWDAYRMSAAMESVLKGYKDPRMPVYFSPAEEGDSDGDGIPYEGLRNGQARVDIVPLELNSNHSNVGPRFLPSAWKDNYPIPVIRAAEAYFLRAEGALEGWNMRGTAKELYEEGIRMSIEEWTSADPTAVDAYIQSSNTPVAVGDRWNTPALSDIPVAFDVWGSKERQLEQIITQKWLALYPDGWEAWAELRRTGYPKMYDRLNSESLDIGVGDIMRRIEYPKTEYTTNGDAVKEAVASEELDGKDLGSTRLWWDKKIQ